MWHVSTTTSMFVSKKTFIFLIISTSFFIWCYTLLFYDSVKSVNLSYQKARTHTSPPVRAHHTILIMLMMIIKILR